DCTVPTTTSTPGTPSATDDVFTMVEQAAHVSADEGDGNAGMAAALAFLQAHPAGPQVERVDDPLRIRVTDVSGVTAALRYEVPDTDGRPIEDDHGEQLAQGVVDDWRAHLAQGGGIVASTSGVAMLIPANDVAEFDDALTAALALSGTAKD